MSSMNSSSKHEEEEDEPVYNLVPISSPRLVGFKLQFFPAILRTPLIGNLILNQLKKKNNFDQVSSFASTLKDNTLPLYYPLHEMSIEERTLHDDMIKSDPFSIKDLASLKPTTEKQTNDHLHNVDDEGNEDFFRYWSIYDFTSRYKAREITPTQVANRIIKLVKETRQDNPIIVLMNEEEILREAAASTKRYEEESPQGVLDGVPIAVKDEIATKGYHLTRGTCFMREYVSEDLAPIKKLRREGCMIVGKTNQHEIGVGTTGYNKFYGPPRNPHNMHHYTGGSSSGSAAAVSAGLVPLAIGADGGGSIRIPSSLCGVVGIKPTFKRVAADFAIAPSVASIGPIAATVNDCALAYAIMAGDTTDDFRQQSQSQPRVHLYNYLNPSKTLEDIRIGFFKSHVEDAEPVMMGGTMKAVEFYKSLGAEIVEVVIPHLQEIHHAHVLTILNEIGTYVARHYGHNQQDFSSDVRINLELAKTITAREFLDSQLVRSFAMELVEDLFKTKIDILISPSTASVAPELKGDVLTQGESNLNQTSALMKYMIIGNLTGIPGIVFPVDYDSETRLPVSILLQAAHWREDLLFRVAKAGESILSNGYKKPEGYIGGGLDN